jgi:hypothetical protein
MPRKRHAGTRPPLLPAPARLGLAHSPARPRAPAPRRTAAFWRARKRCCARRFFSLKRSSFERIWGGGHSGVRGGVGWGGNSQRDADVARIGSGVTQRHAPTAGDPRCSAARPPRRWRRPRPRDGHPWHCAAHLFNRFTPAAPPRASRMRARAARAAVRRSAAAVVARRPGAVRRRARRPVVVVGRGGGGRELWVPPHFRSNGQWSAGHVEEHAGASVGASAGVGGRAHREGGWPAAAARELGRWSTPGPRVAGPRALPGPVAACLRRGPGGVARAMSHI